MVLELSPSSNLQTGAIEDWLDEDAEGATIADHPFNVLYELGFKVTVNTDNRLMSATSLTRELRLLTEAFDYTLDDLEQFQLNAADAVFQDREDRDDIKAMIMDGFDEQREAQRGGRR